MGKTVPAYRMALEFEIDRWKGFRKALMSDEDREAFDEMMDLCRIYASESSCATNPIIFEPMVMSIVLGHQKKLRKLEAKINDMLKERGIEESFESKEEGQVGERN